MNICIFGDSITWGAEDFEYGGWVSHLRNYLFNKDESDVYNLGISGDVTTETLKRFDVEAGAREADVIMFALGINDSAFVQSKDARWTPLEEFRQNLLLLYKKAKKFTDKIFFVGLTPVDDAKLSPAPFASFPLFYNQKTVSVYNATIEAFCTEHDIPFIAMEGVLSLDDLPDGLHPNTGGHKKMFEKIKNELDSRVSRLREDRNDRE